MAAGIVSYGAYLPSHCLDRGTIRSTLGQGGGSGTRAVAAFDQDSTALGVEAARAARWNGSLAPASLHFATTAPAYVDKTNATAVHAALGLDRDVFAADHGGSIRSGISALRAAAAEGGLAVLADIRTGRPGSADEAGGGDGAAAFLFGDGDDVLAQVAARASLTEEFLDRWRAPGEIASSTWEERFGLGVYLPMVEEVARRALAAASVAAPDYVVVASPHPRVAASVGKAFGHSDRIEPAAGNLGAAHAGVALAEALDGAEPGQAILVLSAADGADAIVLRTTSAIASRRPSRVLQSFANAAEVDYAAFLTWRGVLHREPPRRPDPLRPEGPPAHREAAWKYAFTASRCTRCERVHLPPQRVCARCGATDTMARHPMADRPGTISTYTVDRLAYSLSPPSISAAIDFDGGGRFSCELTDCAPEDVAVGMRVEMTFRRMYTAQGVHNYFWKARPAMEDRDGQ